MQKDSDCYLSYLQSRERIPTKSFQSCHDECSGRSGIFMLDKHSVNLRVHVKHTDIFSDFHGDGTEHHVVTDTQ